MDGENRIILNVGGIRFVLCDILLNRCMYTNVQ